MLLNSFSLYCKPGNLKRFKYSKDSINLERCSNQLPDTVRNVAHCATKSKKAISPRWPFCYYICLIASYMSNLQSPALSSIITILEQVLEKITDGSDIVWTRFNTPKEMRQEITTCLELLKKGELGCLDNVSLLFAPTGAFQEHSISNGWSDAYMQMSASFDQALASISR